MLDELLLFTGINYASFHFSALHVQSVSAFFCHCCGFYKEKRSTQTLFSTLCCDVYMGLH